MLVDRSRRVGGEAFRALPPWKREPSFYRDVLDQIDPTPGGLETADRDRFERFNIVIAILLAGWTPSILMLVVSYTMLTNTLESKILHDRQAFVQLIAHLVGDDLSRTGSVIEYYQTQPDSSKCCRRPTLKSPRNNGLL